MIKLLYVENALAIYGGMERVLVDKLNRLVEYGGYEVCLLTVNQGDHPIVFPLHPKVEYHDLRILFYKKYRYSGWKRYRQDNHLHKLFQQRMAEKIREFSPDVIICTRLGYVYDVIRVKGNIPFVFESHNSCRAYKFMGESRLHRLRTWFYNHQLRKAQAVVALTNGDAMEWKRLTPNVRVIPNVVHLNNTGRFSDCRSKSIIFVGRYSYQKDIRTLLEIWIRVYLRYPDWSLHMYGGYGNDQEELLPHIKKMNMNIFVHEPTPSIFEEYQKCSMLLMTSRYEPFGLVLPEAMSCGLPVIAFDCPYGPADIITDRVDGFLIKNRNVDDYVEKVCWLIEDEELRRKMGEAGVLSSQRYEANRVMPQWDSLFHELTSGSR